MFALIQKVETFWGLMTHKFLSIWYSVLIRKDEDERLFDRDRTQIERDDSETTFTVFHRLCVVVGLKRDFEVSLVPKGRFQDDLY